MLGLEIFVQIQTFWRRPYKRLRATSATPEYNNDSLSTDFPQSLFVSCRLPSCGLKLPTLNLGLEQSSFYNNRITQFSSSGWQVGGKLAKLQQQLLEVQKVAFPECVKYLVLDKYSP